MIAPLEGLRVVDCSLGDAGPRTSGFLADYGAQVVWIEPPGGDPARRRDPAAASVFNRGKRSLVLDLDVPKDRATAQALAMRADVFLHAWPPSRAAALGLDGASLQARNPQLICCALSGFGPEPAHQGLPAYEPLVHALYATMVQQLGHRDGPIFQALPFAAAGAAQLATLGVLAALFRRLEDGIGRRVETSLADGALAFHCMQWGESDAALAASGVTAPSTDVLLRQGTTRMVTRSFVCSDGQYLGVHTLAVGGFSRLMQVLELNGRIAPAPPGQDLAVPLTAAEADYLEANIHRIFARHPRAYWVERLTAADVCAIEHLPPTQVFDHPQARHNGMVLRLDDPELGEIEQAAPGLRFDGEPPPPPKPAPKVGEHAAEILAELAVPAVASAWRTPAPHGAPDTRPLLAGVKVVDLGAFYAGPYASRLLADFGAEVIKVEPTVGDQMRGLERGFFAAQAGKRSLAANLKHPALAPALAGLIGWADIVHHNMRPGAAERLGVGAEQVRALNPHAIYLYSPGWGVSGPDIMRQSFAPMLCNLAGASFEVAGQYNEPMPPSPNEDVGNGLAGAIAMVMALIVRRRTGRALSCESPQLNAAMSLMAHIVRDAAGAAIGAERLDVTQSGTSALESLYPTADGWLCLAARTDEEIARLGAGLDLDLLGDRRFATAAAREANREVLAEQLRAAFARRPAADWLAEFHGAGLGLVQPVDRGFSHRFLNDPQQRRNGRVAEVFHPEKGQVREIDRLLRISDAALPLHRLAPGLGQHTDEVLALVGCDPASIAQLRAAGAVR